MSERIIQEIELLKKYYPIMQISDDKNWIMIPEYNLPVGIGWNKEVINVVFCFPNGFPGAAPYGIYVPSDILFNDLQPDSYQPNAANKPPFDGEWGMLSWTPELWQPSANILQGTNMYNFVQSFIERFKQGK